MQRGQAGNRAGGWVRGIGLIAILQLSAAVGLTAMAQYPEPAEPKPPPAIAEEYQQRFNALDSRDIRGHFALAQWCEEQQRYDLVVKQTEYILKLAPKFMEARLLHTTALRKLGRDARPVVQSPAEAGLVSKNDVQKLRFAELLDFQPVPDPAGPQESVSVRFGKGLLNDFLDAVKDVPEFAGRQNRQRFLSLKPIQQLQVIREYSGTTYESRIEILTDPLVFRRFRAVVAIIERGCGGAGCHSGDNPAPPFGLRSSYLFPEQSLYTKFLVLDRVVLGRYALIDRSRPADSLILQYGLPAQHARVTHPTPIKPLFPAGPTDANYRLILDWVDLLRFPRPNTGVKFEGYPEPPPLSAELAAQIAGKTATKPAPARP